MSHVQPSFRPITKRRNGKLDLRVTDPTYTPQTRSLVYLGKTEGFAVDLEPVAHDDFVKAAIEDLCGDVPQELVGWTRSHATLERLFEGMSRYDNLPPRLEFTPELKEAITIAYEAFHIPGGVESKPMDQLRLELNASAGWSWLGMKKRDVYDSAIVEADKLTRLFRNGRYSKRALPPCVCFKRTQLAQVTNPKVRTVWGYPFELTLIEGKFAQPLIDAYSHRDSPMFIGRSMLKELPMFIDGLFHHGIAVGIDWSGFDAAHSHALIGVAFDVLRNQLRLSDAESKELDAVIDYFVNTPVVMPNGEVYLKHIGIPSGSFFTQLIGSVINFIVTIAMMLKFWKGAWRKAKFLSDDSVFSVDNTVEFAQKELEAWAIYAKERFGLTMNLKKTFVAERPQEIEFLGHAANAGSVKRDDVKLLRLALYPEYRVQNAEVSLSRVRGLLIDSGFQSWLTYDLYDYMVEKYGDVAAISQDKFWKYVIRREVPSGAVRRERLWALS